MAVTLFDHLKTVPGNVSKDSAMTSARSLLNGNLSIPILLLMLLGMMILPLPAFLLDAFFSFNIALSIVVLLVSVYCCQNFPYLGSGKGYFMFFF